MPWPSLLALSGLREANSSRVLADALSRYIMAEAAEAQVGLLQVAEAPRGAPANWSRQRRMDTGEEDTPEGILRRRDAKPRLPAGSALDRAVCRSRVAADLHGAVRHEIGSTHTTNALVQEFTSSAATGIAGFFIEYATVTLPNIFLDALIDVLCDIICYGLIFAVASAVSDADSTTSIAKGVATEVLFAMPPAFTVYMTASLSLYLSHMLVGYLARTITDFIDADSMPRISDVTVSQLGQTLSTSIPTTVLGTLPHTLTLTLTHSLTHALSHYYYCTYCFYYGDYCQYCFYYRDYQWLKRMWWAGSRVPDASEGVGGGPRPQVTRYQPNLGHTPTAWTPPHRLDLKPGG